MPTKKYVYKFAEGNKDMREILGGKGANLAEMARLGFPVPNGFTVSTEACTKYYEDGREINDEIQAQINEHIAWLEKENGKKFGDPVEPLLVSVRSGARASMPGMMDTILNLGLNDVAVEDGVISYTVVNETGLVIEGDTWVEKLEVKVPIIDKWTDCNAEDAAAEGELYINPGAEYADSYDATLLLPGTYQLTVGYNVVTGMNGSTEVGYTTVEFEVE